MQVVQQLSSTFQPAFKTIKSCIEVLIEREFLERDRENANLYRYLA